MKIRLFYFLFILILFAFNSEKGICKDAPYTLEEAKRRQLILVKPCNFYYDISELMIAAGNREYIYKYEEAQINIFNNLKAVVDAKWGIQKGYLEMSIEEVRKIDKADYGKYNIIWISLSKHFFVNDSIKIIENAKSFFNPYYYASYFYGSELYYYELEDFLKTNKTVIGPPLFIYDLRYYIPKISDIASGISFIKNSLTYGERSHSENWEESASVIADLPNKIMVVFEDDLDSTITRQNFSNFYPYPFEIADLDRYTKIIMGNEDKYAFLEIYDFVIKVRSPVSILSGSFVYTDYKDKLGDKLTAKRLAYFESVIAKYRKKLKLDN